MKSIQKQTKRKTGDEAPEVTYVSTKSNRITKKRTRIGRKYKNLQVFYFPSKLMNKQQKVAKKPNKKKCRKTELIPYKYRYFNSFFDKKKAKLQSLAKNCVQLFCLDEQLTESSFAMGNIVEIRYGNKTKLVILTTRSFLLANKTLEKMMIFSSSSANTFDIDFFDTLLKNSCLASKQELMDIAIKKQAFKRTYVDKYFWCKMHQKLLHESLNTENKFKDPVTGELIDSASALDIILFELPVQFLSEVDYSSIPVIDLEDDVKSSPNQEDKTIFVFSMGMRLELESNLYKNTMRKETVQAISEMTNGRGQWLNFGEIYKHDSSGISASLFNCSHGAVGSCVYNINNLRIPIGINIGCRSDTKDKSYNYNLFLSLTNNLLRTILKEYLDESQTEDAIVDYNL